MGEPPWAAPSLGCHTGLCPRLLLSRCRAQLRAPFFSTGPFVWGNRHRACPAWGATPGCAPGFGKSDFGLKEWVATFLSCKNTRNLLFSPRDYTVLTVVRSASMVHVLVLDRSRSTCSTAVVPLLVQLYSCRDTSMQYSCS